MNEPQITQIHADLKKELAALKMDFQEWARHSYWCNANHPFQMPCDCGLEEILRRCRE